MLQGCQSCDLIFFKQVTSRQLCRQLDHLGQQGRLFRHDSLVIFIGISNRLFKVDDALMQRILRGVLRLDFLLFFVKLLGQ